MPDTLQEQLGKMRREAEERDAQRRAASYKLGYLEPAKVSVSLDALALLPLSVAQEALCSVVEAREKTLALVAYDPHFSKTRNVVKDLTDKGFFVTVYVVSRSSLERTLGQYRFVKASGNAIAGEVSVDKEAGGVALDVTSLPKAREAMTRFNGLGTISELVESILLGGLANRASDIHFEPREKSILVRFRIDGILHDVYDAISLSVYRSILSRIKLLSNLKINIKDQPQDGRFTIQHEGHDVEVRVAIAPAEFGEVIVLRLLDPVALSLQLSDLGLRQDDLVIIEKELKRPNGMIINTGPTGSGKTTTLYAFLKHVLSAGVKIITIEDPIEYHLGGIEQTQVDVEAGYTFATGLRSLMRQDPDIILVGEIRDKETAEIAVQAALTGHLVFSTVHANSASAGVPRLFDLGVKSASLAPALNVIIAQRLVRRLCDTCKKPTFLSDDVRAHLDSFFSKLPGRVEKIPLDKVTLFEAVGCDACDGSGYKGRVGIYELLLVDEDLQRAISSQEGQLDIEKIAKKAGLVSMQQDGILKVLFGATTFEEIERISGSITWE